VIERLVAKVVAGVAWLLTGATARWLGCSPEPTQRVYYANHTSHLDFVVLWSALPRALRERTRPVAGADYWLRGALRRYLAERVFRAVLIERRVAGDRAHEDVVAAARAAVATTAAALATGDSLILFPEGTRGPGGLPQPFKSGLFHLCVERPGLVLVPVWLDHLNRVLPKGEFAPVPLAATATFGVPLALEPGEGRDAFLARAHAALVALWSDRPRQTVREGEPR
jgi:1-acyl-sn-glycerol-3-phosphate acyltransferase